MIKSKTVKYISIDKQKHLVLNLNSECLVQCQPSFPAPEIALNFFIVTLESDF